jgi:hypothetical protein
MAVTTPQAPLSRSKEKVPVRPDGRLARVGPDVFLYQGGQRGFAHVVFPVDAGVDEHVDVAGLAARLREAGPGGGVGEAPRGRFPQAAAGQHARGFNVSSHSGPPCCRR